MPIDQSEGCPGKAVRLRAKWFSLAEGNHLEGEPCDLTVSTLLEAGGKIVSILQAGGMGGASLCMLHRLEEEATKTPRDPGFVQITS